MRILIVTPQAGGLATGNRCSAEQWRDLLVGLGHQVEVGSTYGGQAAEVLVALHAVRSEASIAAFPGRVVVVLTGTDIYPQPGDAALASMRRADALVALQSKALEKIPAEWHLKTRVILQAAPPVDTVAQRVPERFDVAVVAHLRAVKDPLRAARATRLLPGSSKVRVRHAGGVLEPEFEKLARSEVEQNPRYEWLGALEPREAAELIAGSHLLAVTSRSEGAGRVVGEAIALGTPVVSSRIDGVVGLLGEDYPGYFPVGDTRALADLFARAEDDPEFYGRLRSACGRLAERFAPATEAEGWRRLIDDLGT